MSTQARTLTRRLIETACRAPSVHNTQPWRWRIQGDTIELWADRDRQLPVADPDGRNLAISCGAAVHHLIVTARALGVTPSVRLLPRQVEADLFASVELASGRPATDALKTLEAIERRRTDRRRFTSWPVPEARLAHLAQAAAGWGAYAIPVVDDASARFRAELLLSRAQAAQESDRRFAREQASWVDHSATDGVPPPTTAPPSRVSSSDRPNRLAPEAQSESPGALVERSEGLVVICTVQDDQRAWLEAGEVLSALWLRATQDGLSLVPLSQVIEVPETRESLHHDLLAGMAHPQILLRIGWQEIGRAPLTPTPRRPLSDVLLP